MKIEKIKGESKVEKFLISDTDFSFMNTLRRACSFEVPVLAAEDIYITKNSSALYDEIIAHRIGLIPLKTDLKTYKLTENCKCKGKGCASCQVKLTLSVKGPKIVRAGDIKTTDPSIKPVYKEMPILELIKGQEIELEIIAKMGRGKEHIKWSPALAFYQKYPEIKISNGKKAKEGIKHCPRNVFDKNGKIKNILNCNLCRACQDHSEDTIKVKGYDTKFIFSIEPWGQLNSKQILKKAMQIIEMKLKEAKLK